MTGADDLARRVGQEVRTATGLPVRDAELSQRIASACGATVRAEGRLPTPQEEDDLVSALVDHVVESSLRGKPLDADAFAEQAAYLYSAAWLARGGVHLSAWPPSAIALGHDERPPLVTPASRLSRTWTQGTDRSVYSRYCAYYDGRARLRVGSQHRHDCRYDERGRSEVVPLTLAVDLACEPYGLEHPGHQQLLQILAAESDKAPGDDGVRPALPFVDWDTECCPTPGLGSATLQWVEDRVRTLIALWWATGSGHAVRRRFGDPGPWLHQVRALLVRRVWMELAGREREHLDPCGTCRVDGFVRTALTKGVGIELPALLRGERGLPPAPTEQRINATLELLLRALAGSTPTRADLLSTYADLLEQAGPSGEHTYLSQAELGAVVAGTPIWEDQT